MKIVITTCLVLLTPSLAAEEQQRVYQTDAYGRVKQQKFIIKNEQGLSK